MVQLLSNNAIRKRPCTRPSETHPEQIDIFVANIPVRSILSAPISTLEQSADIILSRIADAFQKWLFVVTRSAVSTHEIPGAKHHRDRKAHGFRSHKLSARCPVNSASPSEKSLAYSLVHFLPGTSRFKKIFFFWYLKWFRKRKIINRDF